jgi:hypothetical protein
VRQILPHGSAVTLVTEDDFAKAAGVQKVLVEGVS